MIMRIFLKLYGLCFWLFDSYIKWVIRMSKKEFVKVVEIYV